jgi:hypothetical protein
MKTAITHLEAQKQTLLHNAAVFHREGRTQERDTALDDANDITGALMVLESRTPVLVENVLPEPILWTAESRKDLYVTEDRTALTSPKVTLKVPPSDETPKDLGPIGKAMQAKMMSKLVKEKPSTVKEWLATIPESEAALRNMDPRNSESPAASAQQALARAFGWGKSPEGFNYWSTVYDRLQRESLTPSSENTTLPV